MDEELLYSVALAKLPGANAVDYRRAVQVAGSARAFMSEPRRYGCDCPQDSINAAIVAARDDINVSTRHNITIRPLETPLYPHRLAECPDAPLLLYTAGDVNLDARYVIGIVGTRHSTAYGQSVTENIVERLAELVPGTLVVSGFAFGIDVAAHNAAVRYGLQTAGVLAHGLDHIYPTQHTSLARELLTHGMGGIVSEYTYKSTTRKSNFLARNRIIAGLSDCVLVCESAVRGGALNTAREARDYSRRVFAVPGRIFDVYSEGCNDLIRRQEAQMVLSGDDIVDAMNWESREVRRTTKPREAAQPVLPMIDLSPEESSLCELLVANGSMSLEHLTASLGMPLPKVVAMATSLEIRRIITGSQINKYQLCSR